MSEKISRVAFLEGRELLKRLRVRFPILFPADRRDLKPWAVGEDARVRQALADAEDDEGSVAEKGRVGGWRGSGRRMGVAVPGGFRNAGASLPAITPFPVAAHRTGRADLLHPALGRDHAFAHGRPAVRSLRRVRP